MYDELKALSGSDMYPFHMPGHKRRMPGERIFDPYSIDITEIDGFDNMHDPEGLIKELNRRLCSRFGGDEARILVNGSTSGVLSAVSAAVKPGGRILMARNSHKSAYDAVELRGLDPIFIYPGIIPGYRLNGGIAASEVEAYLSENTDTEAVFITSPTYEGMVSDIGAIAKICHSHGIPLIVDSAHGAHAGLYGPFTEEYGLTDAVAAGADIAIESLHKTLPCFTQTAMVLLNKGYIDFNRFGKYYSVYQTSSPSYIFMAGADNMLKLLDKEGEMRFRRLDKNLRQFRDSVKGFRRVHSIGPEYVGSFGIQGFDPTKILISAEGFKGMDVYRALREKHHLQPEMAAGDYVLLMTSIMDEEEGFIRLYEALKDIELNGIPEELTVKAERQEGPVRVLTEGGSVTDILKAEGKISDRAVYAYPPGIPVIAPGEFFTKEIIEEIMNIREQGLTIKGLSA